MVFSHYTSTPNHLQPNISVLEISGEAKGNRFDLCVAAIKLAASNSPLD